MRKTLLFGTALALVTLIASCDIEPQIIDSSQPQGEFTAAKSGEFVDQNSAGSAGKVELGTDGEGNSFLRFDNAFTTNLATGTVTVFLSTSDTFTADPGNGNPDLLLISGVHKSGENFFKLDTAPASKFTHVILWCGSAAVPFGNAELN